MGQKNQKSAVFFKRALFSIGALVFLSSVIPLNAQEALKDQLKTYEREDIHSIHKKLYNKQGRHEASFALGGIINHNAYYLGLLQYQYHFFENLGLEAITGGFAFKSQGSEKLYLYQGGVTFSPLYGKVSLFTWAIMNFDIYLAGGAGAVKYDGRQNGTSFMANVGAGQRFFINEMFSVKIEYRNFIYNRNLGGNKTKIWNNSALLGGVSVMFPFRQKY